MKVAPAEIVYTPNKNNLPIAMPYSFHRADKLYFIPPTPYKKWEETGTYIKINDNIYAEGSAKTFSEFEFVVNKRGGEGGKILFNYPVDFIEPNDKVEFYLKGKLKFVGFVEYIDGASKELSIIPIWGRLLHQYIAGSLILEETKGALDVVKDMRRFIEEAGIIYDESKITLNNLTLVKTEYSGKCVADILDLVEEELSENWCWGVDFNNTFFFLEANDKPTKTLNWFNNDFEYSEYERDTNDLITRYVCKIKEGNGSRTLPKIVGGDKDYPPIPLEEEIGIKVDLYETDYTFTQEQYKEVYDRAYKVLNRQAIKEVVKLSNIRRDADINFNDSVKIIMKPSNNYYNTTEFKNPIFDSKVLNELYSSEILILDTEIEISALKNYAQEQLITLHDIDLDYRRLCLKSYNIVKIAIFFTDANTKRAVSGIFQITDGENTQRVLCNDGFGIFDVKGYDKIKLQIINERANIIYDKIIVFFDIGVREYNMNARILTYTYKDYSLNIEGEFAKMNVKLTNYLYMLESRRKNTESWINKY